jgi:hypothetical protein
MLDQASAAGLTLGSLRWPSGSIPLSLLRHRTLRAPDPGLILAAGDRISVLARTTRPSPPPPHHDGRLDSNARMAPPSRNGDDRWANS